MRLKRLKSGRLKTDKIRMVRIRNDTTFIVLLSSLLVLTISCMPKVEEESAVPVVKLTSAAVNGATNPEMKISLSGTCPTSTYVMKVLISNQEFKIGQSSASTAANSGTPVGSCSKGILSITYPVPNPTVMRSITFKVKAQLSDGRTSVNWATRTVSYVPPSPTVPGFAVLAVGGISTGTGLLMHAAGGEPYGGVGDEINAPASVLTSSQAILKSGVHSIIID